jgi:hypothetical protein
MKIDAMTLKRIIKEELQLIHEMEGKKFSFAAAKNVEKIMDSTVMKNLIKNIERLSDTDKSRMAQLILQKLGLGDNAVVAKASTGIRNDNLAASKKSQ